MVEPAGDNSEDAQTQKTPTVGEIAELMVGASIAPALGRRTGEVIRRYSGGLRRWFVGHTIVSLIGTVGQLALPGLAGLAIDQAVTGRAESGFALLAGALAAVSLSAALSEPLLARFTAGVIARGTSHLLNHTLQLGIPGRRPFGDGDLLNRLSVDLAQTARYPAIWWRVGSNVVMAVGALILLSAIDWILTIVWFGAVVVVAAVTAALLRQIVEGEGTIRELTGQLVQRYVDAMAGRRTIRVSGTFDQEVIRVAKPVAAIAATSRRLLQTYGKGNAAVMAAYHGFLVASAGAGAGLLAAGRISSGDLLAAIAYAQLAFGMAFAVFDNGFFHIARTRVHGGRIVEVLDTPAAVPEPVAPGPPPAGVPGVRLDGVGVAGDHGPVLEGVQLDVPAGLTVAIVGESGAGKSTIAALVGRLFDPGAGEVAIGGIPVRQLRRSDLAALVSYAFERPALLGRSIGDTIALGVDATDEEVRRAVRAADAEGFIERLPHGYATPLDDAPLSGGERQRLGLARAALRRSPIVVLDDALSSLDTATEAKVFDALRRVGRGRTTIVVAHRASTAARADLVAWLVDGSIRAAGTHEDLWEDEAYRGAFASSTRGPSPGHALV